MAADGVVLAHQPCHALAVHGAAEAPQLGVDPQCAVGLLVFGVNLADLLDQDVLVLLARGTGLGASLPAVVARSGDTKYPAQPLHAESPGVGGR